MVAPALTVWGHEKRACRPKGEFAASAKCASVHVSEFQAWYLCKQVVW